MSKTHLTVSINILFPVNVWTFRLIFGAIIRRWCSSVSKHKSKCNSHIIQQIYLKLWLFFAPSRIFRKSFDCCTDVNPQKISFSLSLLRFFCLQHDTLLSVSRSLRYKWVCFMLVFFASWLMVRTILSISILCKRQIVGINPIYLRVLYHRWNGKIRNERLKIRPNSFLMIAMPNKAHLTRWYWIIKEQHIAREMRLK